MNTFETEFRQKTDQELQEIVSNPNRWNDDYYAAAKFELQRRGLQIQLKEEVPSIEHKLNLQQRRKICESCQNHSNEIPTNPDSPAICGLTMKDPDFTEKLCEKYIPIPAYKNYLLRMALFGFAGGLFSGVIGYLILKNELRQGTVDFRGVVLCILCPILIVYSIVMLIKMFRFKYPNETE